MENQEEMTSMDTIILGLFQSRWVGEESNNLTLAKSQLYKSLKNQMEGYWSGHTAYNIMVDGGFIIDANYARMKPKRLTEWGKLFMKRYEEERYGDE